MLIDEIDRADEAFEAFLLELLADYQMTVPELGTVVATSIPRVILTSNGTRELSDALRRRCLYHWLDYPDLGRLRPMQISGWSNRPSVLYSGCARKTLIKRREWPKPSTGFARCIASV